MALCFRCCNQDGYHEIETNNGQIVQHRLDNRLGIRHLQCFLAFCGLGVAYALRVNLSLAIVAMTDRNSANPNFQDFNWDEKTQSILLSSFFWGYVVTQIPGGYMAHKYGAKCTLFCGLFMCSLLAILTPISAKIGDWQLLCVLRVFQGLCQGVIFPSTHTFLSKWAPPKERARFVTYCYSGTQLGAVCTLASSGYIASSRFGWPSIFYLTGLIGIIWSIAWLYLSSSTPSLHSTISEYERYLIESSINNRSSLARNSMCVLPLPWVKILKSMPFWTLLIVHSSNNWGFWTLLTEIPTYMKNILGFNIKNDGPLSAIPYLFQGLLCYVFVYIDSKCNQRNCMSLSVSRKVFNTIGLWIPMIALLTLGYVTSENAKLAVVLLTIAIGLNSATYLGFQVNHIDLSPNFAGTLMGLTNCAANIMSIIAPLTVGVIVTDEKNQIQWRIIFFITSGFYFFGNLLFILYGKTEIQSWNYPSVDNRQSSSSSEEEEESESLTAHSA